MAQRWEIRFRDCGVAGAEISRLGSKEGQQWTSSWLTESPAPPPRIPIGTYFAGSHSLGDRLQAARSQCITSPGTIKHQDNAIRRGHRVIALGLGVTCNALQSVGQQYSREAYLERLEMVIKALA
jgi:hypothetical protein